MKMPACPDLQILRNQPNTLGFNASRGQRYRRHGAQYGAIPPRALSGIGLQENPQPSARATRSGSRPPESWPSAPAPAQPSLHAPRASRAPRRSHARPRCSCTAKYEMIDRRQIHSFIGLMLLKLPRPKQEAHARPFPFQVNRTTSGPVISGVFWVMGIASSPFRYCAVSEFLFDKISANVPAATNSPPRTPAPGPRSRT